MRSRLPFALACAIACAAATGCETPPKHEFQIAEGVEGAAPIHRVFLAPMNAHTAFPDELNDGAQRVYALVKVFLTDHGVTHWTTSLYHFRELAQQSARAAAAEREKTEGGKTAIGEIDPQVAALAEALAEESAFDAVVIPDLLIRRAKLAGSQARWDGIRRAQEGGGGMRWSGTTNAASIGVRIFDAEGRFLFEGVGGLDLLFRPNVREQKMELVEQPLSDEDHLRRGIAIAFHPFLSSL